MASQIKAIIFDVGGVCVLSPMLAIATYERAHSIPTDYINHAIAAAAPTGAWHKLERGEIAMDAGFFASFTDDLRRPSVWDLYHTKRSLQTPTTIPAINGEELFWSIIAVSRSFDPYVLAAIRTLREHAGFKLAALTNDFMFPAEHPFSDNSRLRALFDVFVSSSHVGMRKPEKGFYMLALERLGVVPEEAVFLDDIGMNLKPARELGIRTVRVVLGETWKAVRELEGIIGVKLLPEGEPPRVPEVKFGVGSKL